VSRLASDNPAHRRIMPQTFGVVPVLVSSEATKYRLPEQPGQCVPAILATRRIRAAPARWVRCGVNSQRPANFAGVKARAGYLLILKEQIAGLNVYGKKMPANAF
jgi:hypothetical protein